MASEVHFTIKSYTSKLEASVSGIIGKEVFVSIACVVVPKLNWDNALKSIGVKSKNTRTVSECIVITHIGGVVLKGNKVLVIPQAHSGLFEPSVIVFVE